ncbi:ATP-binding protein [Nocardioides mesophilus]|uniref:ATP-binding protein n=1 Tax=Nocardioides mesophilus TaxID=433659 RepID=A0A7G9REV7_9ACTN|nr:ATP-binding protein [Nocardioides mesophilus]QNN54132.1 ATP-binding protein [Nocardioides mesophilus]
MTRRLQLDPEPQSVRRARRWVVETFEDLGRPDLVDSAELGVSELVTNAILHAAPPITVRVRGSAQHPRVEVHDASTRPPEVSLDLDDDDALLSAVGRGLGLVALYSATWGADLSGDGKVVWFEPTDGPEPGAAPQGDVFDLDRVVAARLAEQSRLDPSTRVRVRLLGMPARRFADFRVWYSEIRRELRILAVNHPGEYPLAEEVSQLTLQVEAERAQTTGIGRLDSAIVEGEELVDLEYLVPPTAPDTMRRSDELMDRIDEFTREQGLLTLPATEEIVRLRRWYLGEFVRQATGAEPLPWPEASAGPGAR